MFFEEIFYFRVILMRNLFNIYGLISHVVTFIISGQMLGTKKSPIPQAKIIAYSAQLAQSVQYYLLQTHQHKLPFRFCQL